MGWALTGTERPEGRGLQRRRMKPLDQLAAVVQTPIGEESPAAPAKSRAVERRVSAADRLIDAC
jgi:hypothetical protein